MRSTEEKTDHFGTLGKKLEPEKSPPRKPRQISPGIWENADGKLETRDHPKPELKTIPLPVIHIDDDTVCGGDFE